ncbi:putative reverse transcriptase domain-containing protein [Tanacetum coccineum]
MDNYIGENLWVVIKEELYAKFSMSEFWIPKVQFLSHVVDSKGIHVDSAKIESMKDWASPKTARRLELRTLLFMRSSHKGLSAVLMKNEKVIAYASRQLKIHEKNYTTHDSDLQHILDQKELNMRQRRWLDLLIITEYLVNISKRRAFWSLNEDILKITILKTNTPYPSRKIRRIRACTHQRPQRKEDQYAVSRRSQYAVLKI